MTPTEILVLVVSFIVLVNLLVLALVLAASWTDRADERAALRRQREEQGRKQGIGVRCRPKTFREVRAERRPSWSGPEWGRW